MNISQALRIVLDLAQENALDEKLVRDGGPSLRAEAKRQADAIMLVEQMVKRGIGGVK